MTLSTYPVRLVPPLGQGSLLSLQADVTSSWINGGEQQVQQGTIALTSAGDLRWDVSWTKDTMWRFPAGSQDLELYNAQTHRFYELYTQANGALEEGDVEENLWSPLVAGDHSFLAVGLMQRFAAIVAQPSPTAWAACLSRR